MSKRTCVHLMKSDKGSRYVAACGIHGSPCVPLKDSAGITCARCVGIAITRNRIKKKKIARAIYTASLWHDDTTTGGIALLSLDSTRKIHTQEHKENLIREIDKDIEVAKGWVGYPVPEGDTEPEIDIKNLQSLREVVLEAPVGEELISYQEYFDITERLYEAGLL